MEPAIAIQSLVTAIKNYWFAFIVAYYVLRAFKRRYLSNLRNVPGPFLASISRLNKVREVLSGVTEKTQLELHRKYGPIVRIGPNEVSISDPAAIPIIYDNAATFIKTDFYAIFGFPTPKDTNTFSQCDPDLHRQMKKNVASAYSMTSVVQLEPFVNSTIALFMKRMKECCERKNPINLVQWYQWYAFDVIGELSFSRRFGFLDECKDIGGTCKMLDSFIAYTSAVAMVPEMHNWLLNNPLLKLFVTPPASIIADMANSEAKERLSKKLDRTDIMSKFFESQVRNPDKFPLDEVFRHCAVNVSAGSETTGISLDALTYHVLKHPSVYKKLQEEIDTLQSQGRLSDPPLFRETNQDAMPYLAAVIKETFRIHPPVSLTLPRHVPKGGATFAGRFFPEGTRVGISAYVVHRDRALFGDDADSYRPERWLECTREHCLQMEQGMLHFSAGARTCLGKHIAMMEMCKLIPAFFRSYDLQLVDPKKEWEIKNYTFLKPKDIMVQLRPRNVV
ncbi:hypothetical protein RUND412_000975 [Rhizina undulata]